MKFPMADEMVRAIASTICRPIIILIVVNERDEFSISAFSSTCSSSLLILPSTKNGRGLLLVYIEQEYS